MSKDGKTNSESCPVDSVSRAVWLESQTSTKTSSLPLRAAVKDAQSGLQDKQNDSYTTAQSNKVSIQRATNLKSLWESLTTWPPPPGERRTEYEENNYSNNTNDNLNWKKGKPLTTISLGVDREISTIPRTQSQLLNSGGGEDENKGLVANCENESGVSPEGNWIYPSEKMFFDAMRRKGFNSEVRDMKTIVPIHNAVNEQAWKEIKQWEKPWLSEKCDGPKLHSFKGLPSSMTPKARFNTWLGYMAPFDRHDWVVDRCGKTIEYVIDFYAGRDQSGQNGNGKLNFYLDVRPKLNTLEGWKMRASKFLGLV